MQEKFHMTSRIYKILCLALLFSLAPLHSQVTYHSTMQGATQLPPVLGQDAFILNFYDGSNNLAYTCWTTSNRQSVNTYSLAAKTLTSIADSSNTSTVTAPSHGLASGAKVTITGSTEDTDLNGTYTITVTTADAFTITTANVTDATYTTATLVVTNTGPKDTSSIWAIQGHTYSGTNRIRSGWASGSPAQTKICASRATYDYR